MFSNGPFCRGKLSTYLRMITALSFLTTIVLVLTMVSQYCPDSTIRSVDYFRNSKRNSSYTSLSDWTTVEEVEDKNHRKSNDELYREAINAIKNIPNSPSVLWLKDKQDTTASLLNETCGARFPTIYDIKFMNTYWQVLSSQVGSLYLYGAYYDNRPLTLSTEPTFGPAVRILGVIDEALQVDNATKFFCQLWIEKNDTAQVVFSPVIEKRDIWDPKWGRGKSEAVLLTCKVPRTLQGKVPLSVSVVFRPCDSASNNLRVHYDKSKEKKDFAVCVKGLDFLHEDISIRLVEWIELLRLLGAQKITLYEFAVRPKTAKVLRYYEATDFVLVVPLTLSGFLPNEPRLRHIYLNTREHPPLMNKRQNELIPYNDCFYRNMYNYEYVVALDSDEVIMPMGDISSWKELIRKIKRDYSELYSSRDAVLYEKRDFIEFWLSRHPGFPGIPKFMHLLQNVYKGERLPRKEERRGVKGFYKTERVLSLHNHYPTNCFIRRCKWFHVKASVAQLQHYKQGCPPYMGNCSYILDPTPDTTIWRYKDVLIRRTVAIGNHLGIIKLNNSIEQLQINS